MRDADVMDGWSERTYDRPVATPKHKQRLAPTIGYGVLMLQAMTAPFALASAFGSTSAGQPSWATGLYLAADLAAVASLVLLTVGRRMHHAPARFAPLTLVMPMWGAIALLSPLQHDSLGSAALYSLYALLAGALSSLPFLTDDGIALFEADASMARRHAVLTTGPNL